jgi:hypothetical protein
MSSIEALLELATLVIWSLSVFQMREQERGKRQ